MTYGLASLVRSFVKPTISGGVSNEYSGAALNIIGCGWMYLSTILDDFSRYVIAWKLCSRIPSRHVTETLELAMQASGCDQAELAHKPTLLSDNGSSYISGELADWIEDNEMSHVMKLMSKTLA